MNGVPNDEVVSCPAGVNDMAVIRVQALSRTVVLFLSSQDLYCTRSCPSRVGRTHYACLNATPFTAKTNFEPGKTEFTFVLSFRKEG